MDLTKALAQNAKPQDIPSLDTILQRADIKELIDKYGHTIVADTARKLLKSFRELVIEKNSSNLNHKNDEQYNGAQVNHGLIKESISDLLCLDLLQSIEKKMAGDIHPVINLTGTVIHTNFGRAILGDEVIKNVLRAMRMPYNLEYDLEKGGRGDRDDLIEPLICELTGAEAATVVNNNAAAVLLTLAALGVNKEVIVSRGELVEIGGAFRMPDVMQSAGCILKEIGTTNRTHLHDYENAINDNTALIMKVHTSNYSIEGFTKSVDEAQLAKLAINNKIPLITDLGAGALIDMSKYGLPKEPVVSDMIKSGCNIVTFSGDKLLGGPQAGIIVGDKKLIEKIKKHPLKRALRSSKLHIAALEATLKLYLCPETLPEKLPTLHYLTKSLDKIKDTAMAVLPTIQAAIGEKYKAWPVEIYSQIGSGSLPVQLLPSAGIAIAFRDEKQSGRNLENLAMQFRRLNPAVIGRINENALLLDMRCLDNPKTLQNALEPLERQNTLQAKQ